MRTLLRCLRVVAMCALVAMMAITIVDVSMRLLLNELVLGSVEVVQLMLVVTVFLALPETFERNEQITVDVVDQLAPPRVVEVLRRVAAIVTAVFLIALAWRTVPPMLDTLEIGDLTSDLQVSLFWYWVPLVVGVVAAAAVAVLALARRAAPPAGDATPRGQGAEDGAR